MHNPENERIERAYARSSQRRREVWGGEARRRRGSKFDENPELSMCTDAAERPLTLADRRTESQKTLG